MFTFFKKKKAVNFFSLEHRQIIADAIANAETQTSGEIRVYVESECQTTNTIDRAREVFDHLHMHQTADKNGVLVYVAIKSRKLAIYADEGIYQRLGQEYWENQVQTMLFHFNRNDYIEGICSIVAEIGEALSKHFPFDKKGDINELPNDMVFGN